MERLEDPTASDSIEFSNFRIHKHQNASGWLEAGVDNLIHKNDLYFVENEYRIKVKDSAGNINIAFAPASTLAAKMKECYVQTLDELKQGGLSTKPPPDLIFRHEETNVSWATDNNLVTVLGDGAPYMGEWNHLVAEAFGRIGAEFYNINWKIDNVLTIPNTPGTGALEVLIAAFDNWVLVYQLSDANKMSLLTNIDSMEILTPAGVLNAIDARFPTAGSNHQKFMVIKFGFDAFCNARFNRIQ